VKPVERLTGKRMCRAHKIVADNMMFSLAAMPLQGSIMLTLRPLQFE
jgi:hypothetical protein